MKSLSVYMLLVQALLFTACGRRPTAATPDRAGVEQAMLR
jgi:hypothetical protein